MIEKHQVEIRAVIFDWGNVLGLPLDAQSIARMQDLSGVPAGDFLTAYTRQRAEFDRDEVTLREYWDGITSRYGFTVDDVVLQRLFQVDIDGWIRVRAPMFKWLQQLWRHGTKTALLSNMRSDHARYLVGRFSWLQRFDVRIFSSAVGLFKPDPRIYRLCLDRLGVSPCESLFIDDLYPNVEAARLEGINAIVFESMEKLDVELPRYLGLPSLPECFDDSSTPPPWTL